MRVVWGQFIFCFYVCLNFYTVRNFKNVVYLLVFGCAGSSLLPAGFP